MGRESKSAGSPTLSFMNRNAAVFPCLDPSHAPRLGNCILTGRMGPIGRITTHSVCHAECLLEFGRLIRLCLLFVNRTPDGDAPRSPSSRKRRRRRGRKADGARGGETSPSVGKIRGKNGDAPRISSFGGIEKEVHHLAQQRGLSVSLSDVIAKMEAMWERSAPYDEPYSVVAELEVRMSR